MMKYIDEYTKQINLLHDGEKVKFNVHFIVRDPLSSFCVEVNQKVNATNAGLINMGCESIAIPHISLYMGLVDSYTMLEKIFLNVCTYAKELSPFLLDASHMYFKGVSTSAPQYLFIDFCQTDFLMQQKEKLDNALREIVHPVDWNMKAEKAHLTVGCYKQVTVSMLETLSAYTDIPSCTISQIGISLLGKRGVCLGVLKLIDL